MSKNESVPQRDPTRPRPDAASASDAAASGAPERQRIAKLMARAGLCSRRDAEAWILAGRVSVNGEVLTSPARDVSPSDTVLVDDAPLPAVEKTRLFLFHKPRGLVTSDHDPEGRATVADFLRDSWPEGPRTVTVGRLDINTEGLLLLTNDGGLARILELPQTGWVRRYRVRAKGATDQAKLDALRAGVTVDGVEYAGIEATLDRTQGANTWLTMSLREGRNREIKRVLETLGLEVNRLIRLSFGPFQLGDLAEGAVEEVRPRVLRDQLGETLAAEAGVIFVDVEAREDAIPKAAREGAIAKTTRQGTLTKTARGDGDRARAQGSGPDKPRGRASRETGDARPARGGDRPRMRAREGAPGGNQIPRREEAPEDAQKRERPQSGSRKHVSTLRRAGAAATETGPRRRIERTDTRDRHDRTVAVERLVATRTSKAPERRGGRPDAAKARLSPSAEAKRVRTARSGGQHATSRGEPATARPSRGERTETAHTERPFGERPRRTADRGATQAGEGRSTGATASGRAARAGDQGDARPSRPDGRAGRANRSAATTGERGDARRGNGAGDRGKEAARPRARSGTSPGGARPSGGREGARPRSATNSDRPKGGPRTPSRGGGAKPGGRPSGKPKR